jgi:putative aldouronate transport system permease protein
MLIPVLVIYIIFCYVPLYGLLIAFKDYSPVLGILKSPWAGFQYFKEFFQSYYFGRLIWNTLLLSVYSIIFTFPIPIIFALLLNEVKNTYFKRTVQTLSYLPHFISLVVVVSFVLQFTARNGLINDILSLLGMGRIPFMQDPRWFRTLYIASSVWQETGWASIIYLGALSAINPELYEAAVVDGAGRWKKIWNVTLPGMSPTIIVLLIMRIGSLMTASTDKVLLMYSPLTYDTADVILSFVFRKGILESNYSYSTAVNLFNSVINIILLCTANQISKKYTDSSLW